MNILSQDPPFPPQRSQPWTDSDEILLRSFLTDRMSSREIGERLSRSRNSIIGKVRRLGLELVYTTRRPTRKIKQVMSQLEINRPLPLEKGSLIPDIKFFRSNAHRYKTLAQLEVCECKYPMSKDKPFLFCGKRARKGPYCKEHTEISYQKAKPVNLERRYGKVL